MDDRESKYVYLDADNNPYLLVSVNGQYLKVSITPATAEALIESGYSYSTQDANPA